MKRWLHRIRVVLKAIALLKRPLLTTFTKTSNEYSTRVQIDAKGIHRYLLILHQTSQRGGDELLIHVNFWDILWNIIFQQDRYQKEVYRQCKLTFARPKSPCTRLNFHYFQPSQGYRIPIGCHPLFRLTTTEPTHPRKNRINFLGSSIPQYAQFRTEIWGMPSRTETLFKIQQKYPHIGRRTTSEEEYVETLQQTEYFISLPGMHMPLCHNFYEAVLSGCTPLIHVNYAVWLDPVLRQHLLPFTYANDDQLLRWIEKIEKNEFVDDRTELTQPIFEFCAHSLSWKSIQKSIETNHEVLICAEEISLEFLIQSKIAPK